jgi:hypothetical protein
MVQATDNAGHLLFESDGVTPIEIPPYNCFGNVAITQANAVLAATATGSPWANLAAAQINFALLAAATRTATPRLILSTIILPLPINCILMGDQHYEVSKRVWDVEDADPQYRVQVSAGSIERLSDKPPTFTVRKSSRGYD